jgi:hypothetical protein
MGGPGADLRYSATGTGGTFGQAYRPGEPWPRITYPASRAASTTRTAALREDFARSRAEPNGGGALPLMGRASSAPRPGCAATQAWNLAGTAPAAAPVTLDGRIHDLWTTPHGVLRAAQRNNATARTEGGKSW